MDFLSLLVENIYLIALLNSFNRCNKMFHKMLLKRDVFMCHSNSILLRQPVHFERRTFRQN